MSMRAIEALIDTGGGLPASSASITVTEHQAGRVTVSTWNTCLGVSGFVASFLGEPGTRAETMQPSCCRCDPAACAADDTGDHCVTAGCAYCVDGCPAPDGVPCCQGGTA